MIVRCRPQVVGRVSRPHRLVWSRTPGFHPGNSGSNPDGVTRLQKLRLPKRGFLNVEGSVGIRNLVEIFPSPPGRVKNPTKELNRYGSNPMGSKCLTYIMYYGRFLSDTSRRVCLSGFWQQALLPNGNDERALARPFRLCFGVSFGEN